MSKADRLQRLFHPKSGRTLIVALDHGLTQGPLPGITNLTETVKALLPGKPQGLLLNPGPMRRLLASPPWPTAGPRPALVLRLDYLGWVRQWRPTKNEVRAIISTVEEALELNCEAVILFLVLGTEYEAENVAQVARVAAECHAAGMPLIVEATAWYNGSSKADHTDPRNVTLIARMADELGADLIKTNYTGKPESFHKVVTSVGVPVLALGGSHTDDEEAMIGAARGAIAAGAVGLVYGRNVWQTCHPAATLQALLKVTHES